MISQEDGVSEIVGFVLVFAIVISGIALVTLEGYPMLMTSRMAADEAAMEQSFFGLQDEIRMLTSSAVPYCDVPFGISDGTVEVIEQADGAIVTVSSGVPVSGLPLEFQPGAICSRPGEGEAVLLYENGAVIRGTSGENGSVMLSPPRWFFDTHSKTLVIPCIVIQPATTILQRTGRGISTFSLESQYEYVDITFPEPGTTIILDYSPGRVCNSASAWGYYVTNDVPLTVFRTEDGRFIADSVCRLVVKIYNVRVLQL